MTQLHTKPIRQNAHWSIRLGRSVRKHLWDFIVTTIISVWMGS